MIEGVAELIQVLGFPIVAFIMMYVLATRTIKENTKAIQELALTLKERLK